MTVVDVSAAPTTSAAASSSPSSTGIGEIAGCPSATFLLSTLHAAGQHQASGLHDLRCDNGWAAASYENAGAAAHGVWQFSGGGWQYLPDLASACSNPALPQTLKQYAC